MSIVKRVLLLALVSVSGLALLAPLAARSAAEPPIARVDHLLPAFAPPTTELDRGGLLTARASVGRVTAAPAGAVEALGDTTIPPPGSVAMDATLVAIPTPPPPPAPPAQAAAAAAAAPQLPPVTYDGDTVWDALAKCESGGNWSINTGNGYYGGLQFSHSTWHGYGGGEFAEYPHEATREEQIIIAERLHAARGFQPWPACRLKLGLP